MNNSEKRKGFTLLEAGLMAFVVVGICIFSYVRMNRMQIEKNIEKNEVNTILFLSGINTISYEFPLLAPHTDSKFTFAYRDIEFKVNEVIENSGYQFTLIDLKNNLEVVRTKEDYYIIAIPTSYGKTGMRTFYFNLSLMIRGSDNNGQTADVYIMKNWPEVYDLDTPIPFDWLTPLHL